MRQTRVVFVTHYLFYLNVITFIIIIINRWLNELMIDSR